MQQEGEKGRLPLAGRRPAAAACSLGIRRSQALTGMIGVLVIAYSLTPAAARSAARQRQRVFLLIFSPSPFPVSSWRRLRSNRRKRWTTLKYFDDVAHREIDHRRPRLARCAAQVRGQHDVLHREQLLLDDRLTFVDVERGSGDQALLERPGQGLLVDDGPARRVEISCLLAYFSILLKGLFKDFHYHVKSNNRKFSLFHVCIKRKFVFRCRIIFH